MWNFLYAFVGFNCYIILGMNNSQHRIFNASFTMHDNTHVCVYMYIYTFIGFPVVVVNRLRTK